MPAPEIEMPTPRTRRVPPANLTDLERLFWEAQRDGFADLEKAVDRLAAKLPDRRVSFARDILFAAIAIYALSLIAAGRGIDAGAAAAATGAVIQAATPTQVEPKKEVSDGG